MKQTAVMATIADIRATADFIKSLHAAGMQAIRINSAHVAPESVKSMIATVRSVSPGIKTLMDTKGPEMRTTALAGDSEAVTITTGGSLTLTSGDNPTTTANVFVNANNIGDYFTTGNRLFIDDGEIILEVTGIINSQTVRCVVEKGGNLGSRKSLSADKNTKLPPLPAVSQKDRINIEAAIESGIDMIAHSFVRNAGDMLRLRDIVNGSDVQLYAKIECREALENLEDIAAVSDGLLVARGDLGAQIPIERVPAAQMKIMSLCKALGKPVIVATQMLHTMMNSPIPTRAEVSDIAFATVLGADWLLLTGETAKGEYPEECVRVMNRTIVETQQYIYSCKEK